MSAATPTAHAGSPGELSGVTTVVVGASRGLGHGIATAFADAGASVIAVSRTPGEFPDRNGASGTVRPEIADAADATVPGSIIDRHAPDVLVLVAGAAAHMRPLQEQTWETFSVNWQTDVRIAFLWLREALLKPLRPGSRVVVISSGAALNAGGSPLSGGYAGAKATQRFITGYAQDEANRAGLDITFSAVMPQFAPQTGVGRPAVAAYAARAGASVEAFLEQRVAQMGPLVTPEVAGNALVELVAADAAAASSFVLTGAGLRELP